jgi:multidrug resistance protein, MATE family
MNRKILNLAIPNVISNITVPLLGIVDLTVMGHLGSEVYIGAIAVGGMIFNFIYWGFSFLRMGTGGFTAQAFGRRDKEDVIAILARALVAAMAGAFLVIVLQYPIGWLSFRIVSSSAEVEQFASSYFFIRIWAAPATISLYAFTGWFIGMQNARIPMMVAVIVNILNIGFNLLFVFGFNLKSDGVAYGTVVAQYCGLILSIFFFRKYFRGYLAHFKREALRERKALLEFFRVNKDIFIRTLALIFTMSFFTAKSAQTNDTILAVNTLLFQFFIFFSYFVDGFANAGEALTGRYIGARQQQKLIKAVKLIFYWATGVSLVFTIVNILGGSLILNLMTGNEDIIREAGPFIIWIVFIPVVSFTAFIWDGIYVGATASRWLRNSILIALMFFMAAYHLSKVHFGNHGLWFALLLFLAVRGIYLSWFARRVILQKKV